MNPIYAKQSIVKSRLYPCLSIQLLKDRITLGGNGINRLHLRINVVSLYWDSMIPDMADQVGENKFVSAVEAKRHGRTSYYKLLEKAREGEVIRVRRGVYASAEQLASTMIDIEAVVPGGILCLFSAWNIHGMTTSMPQAYHIAIKRGRHIVLPSYPTIELHHYSNNMLEVGAVEMQVDGYDVRIYNAERCVCDAVRFRNKVGMDVCSEIIDSYLSSRDRNLSLLSDYASALRIGSVLQKYLEVKL